MNKEITEKGDMSTIYTVDWMQFLGPDSELPPDVTFNVFQTSGTYKGLKSKNSLTFIILLKFSVRAHKLILAAVSPVFRKMFFSSNNEIPFTTEGDEIEITDSECFAFQNMINFIYSKVGL